jgi:hypothetical protein
VSDSRQPKLNHVRRRFQRATVTFEPVDPNASPAVPGPLIVVRRPLVRLEAQFEPVTGFDLELTLDGTTDAEAVFERVTDLITQLDRYARASGGAGLTLDPKQSKAVPGTVTLRLVPDDPGRMSEQAEVAKQQAERIPGVTDVKLLGV